jgi:hypothetical protein
MVWTTGQIGVQVLVGSRISLLYVIQTCSWAHPASYPMGTGGFFPGGKVVDVWSWPLTSKLCQHQENTALYIHFHIRLHGVVLNQLITGTFTFLQNILYQQSKQAFRIQIAYTVRACIIYQLQISFKWDCSQSNVPVIYSYICFNLFVTGLKKKKN